MFLFAFTIFLLYNVYFTFFQTSGLSKMSSAKGDSVKPRGKMSAYAFFMQTCREERNKNPKEDVADFSKLCAGKWKVVWK